MLQIQKFFLEHGKETQPTFLLTWKEFSENEMWSQPNKKIANFLSKAHQVKAASVEPFTLVIVWMQATTKQEADLVVFNNDNNAIYIYVSIQVRATNALAPLHVLKAYTLLFRYTWFQIFTSPMHRYFKLTNARNFLHSIFICRKASSASSSIAIVTIAGRNS